MQDTLTEMAARTPSSELMQDGLTEMASLTPSSGAGANNTTAVGLLLWSKRRRF